MERIRFTRTLLALSLAVPAAACQDATAPDDSSGRERRVAAYADVGTPADTTRGGGGVGLPILTGSRTSGLGVTTGVRSPALRRGTSH
ncbi:MAG: hypothetical protein IPK85_23075 [Gemmatimonadetes bacterium]|nr:hypothetical protein [Gemmatimonadota bacterium]